MGVRRQCSRLDANLASCNPLLNPLFHSANPRLVAVLAVRVHQVSPQTSIVGSDLLDTAFVLFRVGCPDEAESVFARAPGRLSTGNAFHGYFTSMLHLGSIWVNVERLADTRLASGEKSKSLIPFQV